MAINPNDTKARKSIGKFARALLATTCLTIASGGTAVASLITYNEGSTDFSNTFAGANPLAAAGIPGTTVVNGAVIGEDAFDYFELTGLGTGTFTLQASEVEGGNTDITIFNSGHTTLSGPSTFSSGSPLNLLSQAIPLDGDLVIEIDNASDGSEYTVTVNTTAAPAPEPGTLLTAGLGLAGAVALSRRRRKQ